MWNKISNVFKAPAFLDDEEKTLRARALHVLYINMGGAVGILGTVGVLFVFTEKQVTSLILIFAFLIIIMGMILNQRGYVKASSILVLSLLWSTTVLMTSLSGGIRSLDIIFFVSGTVIAGILFGSRGTFFYAGLSVVTSMGLILAGNAGVQFLQIFSFPPVSILVLLCINLVFTVVPLQVALQNLSESALRAHSNEERYRLIASVMSDYAFSIRYSPDGKIIDQWISGAFEAITGYSSEEYISRGGWATIVHPDDREKDARDMAQLGANQKVVTEIRLVRKDGEVRWVRSYGHPLWDEKNNQLAGIYGAVQDITASKEVENNLLQRAEEMSLLYEISLALTSGQDLYHALRAFVKELKRVMTVDAFHIGLYDSHTDIFSYSLFLNLEDDLQLPPRILSDSPGLTWEVISTKQTLYLPNVSDPKTQHAHNIITVIDVGIRSYVGIPLMLQDSVIGIMSVQSCQVNAYTQEQVRLLETLAAQVAITMEKSRLLNELQVELVERQRLISQLEAKNAEAETLRKSVAIVAATLEKSEAIDRILEQLEQVLPFNSASVQLVNGNVLEIVSARGFDFTRDDKFVLDKNEPAYPVVQGLVPYILHEDVQITIPAFRNVTRNSIHGWMAIPLKVKGKIIGIIALDGEKIGQFSERDAQLAVTYANQVAIALENARLFTELQVELSARQKLIDELESKNAELERFTYTVSHDLRSPLVTIRGFLGFMERNANQGNMEGFRKDMQRVSSATDRMDNLLRDVLELSRIGRLVNQPEEITFEELIQEALEIVHGRIQQRGITVQIQPGLPAIYGDRKRLIEVLQNLLDNSAKYMGDQKAPIIMIGMHGQDESNHPVFFVRDNGMGIDPQYHESIFGMFDKLDPASDGTGIGLALVKRIIELHGGRIWIESEVGHGTTFYFTLVKNDSEGFKLLPQ